LLLLLLHPLYLFPHQISCFSQRRDCVASLRVVEFHQVLHLPDTLKCACQLLGGALLLLLLLCTSLLLLTTFGHTISYLTRSLWHQPGGCAFAEPLLPPS
jgi:hypothetical protein